MKPVFGGPSAQGFPSAPHQLPPPAHVRRNGSIIGGHREANCGGWPWPSLISSVIPTGPGTPGAGCTTFSLVYKKRGNLRVCPLLLGHRKLEITVRYLGIEGDDALKLSEQIEL